MKGALKWGALGGGALLLLVATVAVVYLFGRNRWVLLGVGVLVSTLAGAGALIWKKCKGGGDEPEALGDEGADTPDAGAAAGPDMAALRGAVDGALHELVQRLTATRKKGAPDPLYALPWYLMIGEEGAGKRSSVAASGLSIDAPGAPAVHSTDTPGAQDDQPATLRWDILQDAIILQVPGSYVLLPDNAQPVAWQALLSGLLRVRRREPLNGVIIATAADELATLTKEELRTRAAAVGKRLDELARKLGVIVPTYALVTKCDRIGGMGEFFDAFPHSALDQLMGGLNDVRGPEAESETFVTEVVEDTCEELKRLRLIALGDAAAGGFPPQSLLFPEELLGLHEPLKTFLGLVFKKSPYREPLYLRGLYFASSMRLGEGVAGILGQLGLAEDLVVPQEGAGSLFLKDFFAKLLPAEHGLSVPTAHALGAKRWARSAAFSGWIGLCVVIGLLMSLAFTRNLSAIRAMGENLPATASLEQDPVGNLAQTHRIRAAILDAELLHDQWLLPRFGLTQSETAQERAKQVYCDLFHAGVLTGLDRDLDRVLLLVEGEGESLEVARAVDFLTKRLGLTRIVLQDGELVEALEKKGRPDFALLLGTRTGPKGEPLATLAREGYVSYLGWQGDRSSLDEALELDGKRLAKLLEGADIGFGWLVDWARMQQKLSPVTAANYWGGQETQGSPFVDKPFTPEGWAAISEFIASISRSLSGGRSVAASLDAFEAQYGSDYRQQWERFLLAFDQGQAGWVGRQRRVELAGKLAGPDSPYRKMMDDSFRVMGPAMEGGEQAHDAFPWLALVADWKRLEDDDYRQALAGEGVAGLKTKLSATPEEEKDRACLPHVFAYEQSLTRMAEGAGAPADAFRLAGATFDKERGVEQEEEPAVFVNYRAQTQLAGVLSEGDPGEEIFWNLLGGSARQLWAILLDETEQFLQQKWEEEVLGVAGGASGWEGAQLLAGEEGVLWTYFDQYLAPFVERGGQAGWTPKVLHGDGLTPSEGFLDILSLGKPGPNAFARQYMLRISARPTSANRGAKAQPHRTRLLVECAAGPQEFVNLNYPKEQTLSWSPAECGDVVLEISVGELLLTRRYPGHDGIVAFLHDFRRGSRTFKADAFAGQAGALSRIGVRSITVGYGFQGDREIRRLGGYDPRRLPQHVFK